MSLDTYLTKVKGRVSEKDFTESERFNPANLDLTRRNYFFENGFPVVGCPEKNDPKAREAWKQRLVGRYQAVQKAPQDIRSILTFAEDLVSNFYFELGEGVFGYALSLDPQNVKTYCLLAQAHLDWANVSGTKHRKKEIDHSKLAFEIAKHAVDVSKGANTWPVELVMSASSRLKERGIDTKFYNQQYKLYEDILGAIAPANQ